MTRPGRDTNADASPGVADKPERSPAAPVSLLPTPGAGPGVRHPLLTRSPFGAECAGLDARQAICGSHHRPSIARPCQPCNAAKARLPRGAGGVGPLARPTPAPWGWSTMTVPMTMWRDMTPLGRPLDARQSPFCLSERFSRGKRAQQMRTHGR